MTEDDGFFLGVFPLPDLNTDIRYIKGIGETRAKALAKLDIFTLRDLISYFPRDYEDRSVVLPLKDVAPEMTGCVRATVAQSPVLSHVRRGMDLVKLRAVDESGSVDITFFNQGYVRDQILPGETYLFYGKFGGNLIRLTLTNPVFEKEGGATSVTGRIVPVYRLTAGLSRRVFQSAVQCGLIACAEQFPDYLPDAVRLTHHLAVARYAYENIHLPSDFEALTTARRRLVFEELFVLTCALRGLRDRRERLAGLRLAPADFDPFWGSLPYRPTKAQLRAVSEAVSDMSSGLPMNRLLQGDVGSGKTLVAAACILAAFQNGCQSAYMAPTEILAKQHFHTLDGLLSPLGLKIVKLTGSMALKQKRESAEALALGMADLVVGTHAILSEGVSFALLALVITDEQHRFGVEQRESLKNKGQRPHVLVMSATPIPRTLALMIYGDLDVSVLDELPPGRQKVDTFTVTEDIRPRINRFIEKLVCEGRQVFVVCPMIEENEELPEGIKSAERHAEELKETFPGLRVACIHGKMKPKEKDHIMGAFVRGESDILVSTTVIEVGVDVPNAALMVVENAERFGLSQLHQLRGRVGRGDHKSYCVLFSDNTNETTRERLHVLTRTNDGFVISEEDLRLRGPGDFFGARQHGLPELRIADLGSNMETLKEAQQAAERLLEADPAIALPENARLADGVKRMLERSGTL